MIYQARNLFQGKIIEEKNLVWHANLKVRYDKKKFTVIDLGSANGIIVKPSTILKKAKMLIKSGDEIQVGEILLKLLAIDQDEAHQTEAIDVKDLLNQLKDKNQK